MHTFSGVMLQSNRLGGIAGYLSPVIALVFIVAAILSYPPFSWTNNALSDLGVVPGLTSILFTVGLVGAGVSALIFAVLGLYRFTKQSPLGKAGSVLFAASTVALICIGVFNEDYTPTHYLVSVAFFVLAPIAGFTLTYVFWRGGMRRIAAVTILLAGIAAATWILQFTVGYVPNVAIPEAISAAAISAWVIVISTKLLRSERV
jgi:hypothetical membrane protein